MPPPEPRSVARPEPLGVVIGNRLAALVGATALACLGAEIVLRLLGFAPWQPTPPRFTVDPAGWVHPDPAYGFALAPGRFTVGFPGGVAVPVTHDAAGHRATPSTAGPLLDVHGGSFAYGLGVPDDATLPAQLAGLAPSWQVRNRAAPGYGPMQAWVALTAAKDSAEPLPDAIVLAYAAFQDERVAVTRNWRRSLAASGTALPSLPCARGKRGAPRLGTCDATFTPLPWRDRSVVVSRFDAAANIADNLLIDSHKVTRNLLLHLHHQATQAGIAFLLVGLDDDPYTQDTLRWCGERGVPVLDAGLPWRDPAWHLPFDSTHPNAAAHARWAEQIAAALPVSSP